MRTETDAGAPRKRRRRLRATFWLKSVILGFIVALITGLLMIPNVGGGWKIAAVALAALLFITEVYLSEIFFVGPVSWAIERFLVRRAERSGKPVSSFWFVDVEREEKIAAENEKDEHEEFRDSPMIR